MTIFERITDNRKNAMLNRETEKKLVLDTLLGELNLLSKQPNRESEEIKDDEAIRIVKKMISNNELTNTTHENEYLDIYLPEMMSENKITEVVAAFVDTNELTGPKSMGLVMKFLKDNYAGLYDGKLASEIVKNLL